MNSPVDLSGHGVRLYPDGRVAAEPHPMHPAEDGWTLAIFAAETDADVHGDHWEMHPAGDELVTVLSGQIRIFLRPEGPSAGEEEPVTLAAGSAFVMPRGRWHRIEVPGPSRLMAITLRPGTRLERRAGGPS